MESAENPEAQARATREAMDASALALHSVWLRYFSFTGTAGEVEINAYLNGSMDLPTHERDLVAHAVNELIDELPPRLMAPYSTNGTTAQYDLGPSQEDTAP